MYSRSSPSWQDTRARSQSSGAAGTTPVPARTQTRPSSGGTHQQAQASSTLPARPDWLSHATSTSPLAPRGQLPSTAASAGPYTTIQGTPWGVGHSARGLTGQDWASAMLAANSESTAPGNPAPSQQATASSGRTGQATATSWGFWRNPLSQRFSSSPSRSHPTQNYAYSQAQALESSGLASDDPVMQGGMCSGVAAEWASDRVRFSSSSAQDRNSRLSSEPGLRSAIQSQRAGSDAYLVTSVLTGSLASAQRASLSAMLEPGGVSLIGGPTEYRLSQRGANASLADAISEPGVSLINLYDMRTRGRGSSSTNAGHMLSSYSDGTQVQIFDGNYGEYQTDVSNARSLFKTIVSKYSSSWVPDKVSVQRVGQSESSGG